MGSKKESDMTKRLDNSKVHVAEPGIECPLTNTCSFSMLLLWPTDPGTLWAHNKCKADPFYLAFIVFMCSPSHKLNRSMNYIVFNLFKIKYTLFLWTVDSIMLSNPMTQFKCKIASLGKDSYTWKNKSTELKNISIYWIFYRENVQSWIARQLTS